MSTLHFRWGFYNVDSGVWTITGDFYPMPERDQITNWHAAQRDEPPYGLDGYNVHLSAEHKRQIKEAADTTRLKWYPPMGWQPTGEPEALYVGARHRWEKMIPTPEHVAALQKYAAEGCVGQRSWRDDA